MKDRETFNFYRSFYEAGKSLCNSERLEFYDAILEKSFEKNVKKKKLNGVAGIVFTAILPTITSQNKNYLNGLKGVKAKKTNPPKIKKDSPLDNSLTTYKEKDKYKYKEKENKDIIESFESWWTLYEKKGNHKTALERWLKLTDNERDKCFHVVTDYVKSTPEKKYRKGGEVYINKKAFNDEIVFDEKSSKKEVYTNQNYKPGK